MELANEEVVVDLIRVALALQVICYLPLFQTQWLYVTQIHSGAVYSFPFYILEIILVLNQQLWIYSRVNKYDKATLEVSKNR